MSRVRALSCTIAMVGMSFSLLVFGQPDWTLPAITEGQEARENCLGLIAVLPVMKKPKMQVLMGTPEIYGAVGNSLAVNAVASLAKVGEADALFTLGMLFESGSCFGGKQDPELANKLYLQAASLGSPEAKERARK